MPIINVENITEYRNELDNVVVEYCHEHGHKLNEIPPVVWLDILCEIYERFYMIDGTMLRDRKPKNNEYNKQYVINAFMVYKRLCNQYQQEVCITDFISMTGIYEASIFEMNLSIGGKEFIQYVSEQNKRSLESLMQEKHSNPMRYLPKLNRYHGYNMSGVREARQQAIASVDKLPELPIIDTPPSIGDQSQSMG